MPLIRSSRADVWYTLLLVGISAACAGLLAAVCAVQFAVAGVQVETWRVSQLDRYTAFLVAAPLVALVLGPPLWWWFIVKPGWLGVRRGVGVGVLGGLLAHPLVWYAVLVAAFLTGQPTVAGVLQVTNPFVDLFGAVALSAVTLIWVGWITALVGGLAGGMIALLQVRCGCRERWRAALAV